MFVAQVRTVKLRQSALDTLPYNTAIAVIEWFKQWTCERNFKAVIAETEEKAAESCRSMLRKELVPSWLADRGVKPEHFYFHISVDETDEYNRFWINSSTYCIKEYGI